MIKKLILVSLVLFLLSSCGKKGDPEFKNEDGSTKKLMKVTE
tara:strand:+ start:195 stop:320 length:126 start_codon:yes stop_codon:yes gene_type:complete